MSLAVRVSYFVSLVGSFVLQLYPLRHCVLEVLLGSNFRTRKSTLVGGRGWRLGRGGQGDREGGGRV